MNMICVSTEKRVNCVEFKRFVFKRGNENLEYVLLAHLSMLRMSYCDHFSSVCLCVRPSVRPSVNIFK